MAVTVTGGGYGGYGDSLLVTAVTVTVYWGGYGDSLLDRHSGSYYGVDERNDRVAHRNELQCSKSGMFRL